MKIAVVGSGSIGLVTGTCLACLGNETLCTDLSTPSSSRNHTTLPWEPGLNDLLLRMMNEERIQFTKDPADSVREAEIVFIATENPLDAEGKRDLSTLWKAVAHIAKAAPSPSLVVILGEVPMGTSRSVQETLRQSPALAEVVVAHQAHFLRPGKGVQDFLHPQRLLIGTHSPPARRILSSLYENIPVSIEWMGPRESEWAQYAHDTLLTMKLSFMQVLLQPRHKNPVADEWVYEETEPGFHTG